MQYCSIDMEMTGPNETIHSVLTIGIIVENTKKILPFDEIPKLYITILRENMTGTPYALNLNKDVIQSIKEYQRATSDKERDELSKKWGTEFMEENHAVARIWEFLYDQQMVNFQSSVNIPMRKDEKTGKTYPAVMNGYKAKQTYLMVAGKNFNSLDKRFIEKLPNWNRLFSVRAGTLDPGMQYINWDEDDRVPSLHECKERAGMEGYVSHNSLDDAWDVVSLLRKNYQNEKARTPVQE